MATTTSQTTTTTTTTTLSPHSGRQMSRGLLKEFIITYRQSPCLWKIKSKEYLNKDLKNEAYEKLQKICQIEHPYAGREFVVKKINSLRGSFRREYRRVITEENYIPQLWFYEFLQFTADQECEFGELNKSYSSCSNGAGDGGYYLTADYGSNNYDDDKDSVNVTTASYYDETTKNYAQTSEADVPNTIITASGSNNDEYQFENNIQHQQHQEDDEQSENIEQELITINNCDEYLIDQIETTTVDGIDYQHQIIESTEIVADERVDQQLEPEEESPILQQEPNVTQFEETVEISTDEQTEVVQQHHLNYCSSTKPKILHLNRLNSCYSRDNPYLAFRKRLVNAANQSMATSAPMPSHHLQQSSRKLSSNKSIKSTNICDEFTAYGITVAAKLSRMDPLQRLYAENIINQTLFRGMLNELRRVPTTDELISSSASATNNDIKKENYN